MLVHGPAVYFKSSFFKSSFFKSLKFKFIMFQIGSALYNTAITRKQTNIKHDKEKRQTHEHLHTIRRKTMNKKIVSGILTASMLLGMTASGAVAVQADDSYEVKMQIVTFGQEFPGLADVEAAINAITEPEIGVTVTLDPIAAWDLSSTSSLMITSNEQIDLMCILPMGSNMDSVSNYTTKNMLLPLNDLYEEYGQDIQASIGDLVKVGYVGDSLYAIPANYYAGHGCGFVAVTSQLEELGFSFDEDKLYTVDDIVEVMEAYKAAKGDGYYAIAGFADGDPISVLCPTDDLGDPAVGSLMGGGLEDTTVVNRFATDEYRAAYDLVRGWFNEGLINPDVISITDTWPALLQTGHYLGAFIGVNGAGGLDGIVVNEQSVGEDLTVIRFVEDYATTTIASNGLWAIPVTCGNEEKTMQFLNLLYQERDLENSVSAILSCGLLGSTYQVVEDLGDGRVIVDYAEGVTRATAPYAGQMPVYGDELRTPKYVPITAEMFDQITNYNDTLKYSKAFGYSFDSSYYFNQISAINNVLQTYRAQLAWGTVDVDSVLPQFISDLEAAGINEVIEANQEQLDAWLAEQE